MPPAGLVIQLGCYMAFVVLVVHVHRHLAARITRAHITGLRRLLVCVHASMVLLTARNVYRIVEFAEFAAKLGGEHDGGGTSSGGDGAFYGLDLAPTALTIALLTVLHPGLLLRSIADVAAAAWPVSSSKGVTPMAGMEAVVELREGGTAGGKHPVPAPAQLHGR